MIAHARSGRIGPNAVTRIAQALNALNGPEAAARVFDTAGLAHYLSEPPENLVEEGEVTRLHKALRTELGEHPAAEVSRTAGALTGDYLLAHRIPAPARRALRLLPAPIAAKVLLSAIAKHAWTFSGNGQFAYRTAYPVELSITGCPICQGGEAEGPICDYYTATFERIFQALVSPRAGVQETSCQAMGAPSCTFEIRWR